MIQKTTKPVLPNTKLFSSSSLLLITLLVTANSYAEGWRNSIDLATDSTLFHVEAKGEGDELSHDFAIGDFDNDGLTDLATGPGQIGNTNGGEVHIYSGADGLVGLLDLAVDSPALLIKAAGNDHFGHTMATGDFNGDGVDDLLMGANLGDGPGNSRVDSGEAYVLFGPFTAGQIDLAVNSLDVTIYAPEANDQFAYWVGSGDFNFDGIDDILIGSRDGASINNSRIGAGEAYVIFGSPSLSGTIDLATQASSLAIFGAEVDDHMGVHVDGGDVNGDGIDDILIGAAFLVDSAFEENPGAGKVHVIFGSPTLGGIWDLATDPADFTVLAADNGDGLGVLVTSGDVNGDGIEDLVIGASQGDGADNSKSNAGELHVFFGATDLGGLVDLSVSSADFTVYGASSGDQLAFEGAADDINGDGIDDLLLVSPLADGFLEAKPDAGEGYILFGSTTLGGTIDLATHTADIHITSADAGDLFGFSIHSGDINADGISEMMVGAIRARTTGNDIFNAGEVFVFEGMGLEQSIGLSDNIIDYRNIATGNAGCQTISIINEGTSELHILDLSLTSPTFSFITPPGELTLQPRDIQEITIKFEPTVPGDESGSLVINSDDPNNSSVSVVLNGKGVVTPAISKNIASGNTGTYTDVCGNVFEADSGYSASNTNTLAGQNIHSTDDDPLYQSMRGSNTAFSYSIDNLPVDDYEVTLYFQEPIWDEVGQRIFDVAAEGQIVLDDFDIAATAGGKWRAHTETFIINVPDGTLNLDFTAVTRVALISAISVTSTASSPNEPNINYNPTNLGFGDVIVGTTSQAAVTVLNTGALDLTLSDIAVTDTTFAITSPLVPLILSPGAAVDVLIDFNPVDEITYSGDLNISSDDPDTPVASIALSGTGIPVPPPPPLFLVNAGNNGPYTTVDGEVFEADQTYTAGSWGYTDGITTVLNTTPSGTADPLLYQAVRGSRNIFGYAFDIPNGNYSVTLYFMSTTGDAPGNRIMDVLLEGAVARSAYDIAAEVGAGAATTLTLETSVVDGQLNVDIQAITSAYAMLSAIRIDSK